MSNKKDLFPIDMEILTRALNRYKVNQSFNYPSFYHLDKKDLTPPIPLSSLSSFEHIFPEIDPKIKGIFEGIKFYEEGPIERKKFEPTPGILYHGTSTDALDMILSDRIMFPAAWLIDRNNLVSGELKRHMDREKNYEQNGLKFMSRNNMIRLGMIAEDSKDLYNFGHAFDICFGSFMEACKYADKDNKKRAILGIKRSVAEFHGEEFLDGKGEGILHEGALELTLCLAQLIVPDEKVEYYIEKTKSTYLIDVFPLSDIDK